MLQATALSTALAIASTALAQEASYSDDKLEAFVEAAIAVSQVEERYQAQLAAAESETEREEIIAAANTEIVETIDEAPDVTVDEYVEISQATQANTDLFERIQEIARELQGG
jgi:hypothetical protein